jgi:hypothetical protein
MGHHYSNDHKKKLQQRPAERAHAPQHTMASDLSKADFKAYVESKAFDVITQGKFKRHMARSRDEGDLWAVNMVAAVARVQGKVKDIQQAVAAIQGVNKGGLYQVCKDVMNSAQPPVRMVTGVNTCFLTGETVHHCLDLTRSFKQTKVVVVHPRFWFFFVFLWFGVKLEYVMRSCAKQWMEAGKHSLGNSDFTRLCELFTSENEAFIESSHRTLVIGSAYVIKSLGSFLDTEGVQKVLQAPPEFLDGRSDLKPEALHPKESAED